MKQLSFYCLLSLCLFSSLNIFSQNTNTVVDTGYSKTKNEKEVYSDNGFKFETFTTGINTKYADYGVGFFREKFISFSARKIGALAKKDPNTGEPFTKLYCSDITYEYDLRTPQLFSSILNKYENLGSVTFTEDGNTLYFTKSKKSDSQSFELYRADMNPKREGEWINIVSLAINGDFSIENPHISKNGDWLYFASNRPEAIGGFDIFRIALEKDISIQEMGRFRSPVERVEGSVNTVLDEKFPRTSIDGKYLYFSSKGHDSQGGFDVFRSRKTARGFVATRNLGNTINSKADDIAYIEATPTVGYLTSNREGGEGGYDIYKVRELPVNVFVSGKIYDSETQIALQNAKVVLIDEYGEEVANTTSTTTGAYEFPVDTFLNYTVIVYKDGFEQATSSINTSAQVNKTFVNDIALEAIPAAIIENEKETIIEIENILFDTNSARIKPISTITLNSIVATLNNNPSIKIHIKAHTDIQGSAIYNKKLSMRRAASALKYLFNKGISKERMSSQGYGEEELLIKCSPCSAAQNELNRRVEFIVIKE
ncbi:OmpA family protein [Dokdonia sp. Hel_I_53]|uniref:OmpA family protein n=1 Tax=Dokdonia sp. Hel_I_53 TaxID=1566287 RepID=UPI00119B56B9|nr:OmpA family protein [Dokdonia sp. Hel_I_53]TVZ52942.1 WD40 repeat protein [Dokdonia sp. Hel_I_53]